MTCSEWRTGGCTGRLLAAVAASCLLAGCSGTRGNGLVPVKGVVLLDGKPLTSGVVQFQPAVGQPASGEIAGDGTFVLSRNAPRDGVPPGTYRVAVVAYDPSAETQAVENLVVPLKYTRFGSSGIEFTVFPGTVDPLVISLSSEDADATGVPSGTPASDGAGAVSVDSPGTADGTADQERRGGT